MSRKRPHIIIFNPDEMRADAMRHLGNEAAYTPNMDALAYEGVSFRNAFVQNPVCTPSRCSFMSGWYPHVRGHRTISYMMHKDEPVLLKELKDEGYHVWINGRNDLVPADGNQPFKDYAHIVFNPKNIEAVSGEVERGEKGSDNYYSQYRGKIPTPKGQDDVYDMDAAWVDGAVDFIKKRPKDKPICVFLPLMYPHTPYQSVKKYYDLIDEHKLPNRIPCPGWADKPSIIKGLKDLQGLDNWTEDDWTELRKTYLAMCARVDDQLGQVLEALKEEGIYDDSAIFVFSDHGDFTGDYGLIEKNQNTFEDCLTNVPFIVKPPKDVDVEPGINEALVELIDFYATVEDFTGLTPTHTHFGKSLRKVLSGEEKEHRQEVFCEGGRLHEERHCYESFHNPGLGKETSDYYPRSTMQASEGPEHTKATMIRTSDFKYVKRLDEKDELYDLKNDTENLYNLIDNPEYKEIVLELKDKMLTWLQRTADVVPFKADQRFTTDMLLTVMKSKLPKEKYMRFKSALKSGMSVSQLMSMAMDGKHQHDK
ncbi:sulfatase-like hydrolase/transferase [Vallitalea pronyensis]|uniref:Sulfatase-like hydrolase/transferase n=1 Tax=Vallitalea pronyensis TaxID=1348613 RepID=A0A8J8SGL9_9FIRM|nr:sulfatase-like hydrolase/transferase [Vallitalea pronyensis]QUI22497.1 sulfatase-like hydrolase/transferase [Vallitalea pronyensis]